MHAQLVNEVVDGTLREVRGQQDRHGAERVVAVANLSSGNRRGITQ